MKPPGPVSKKPQMPSAPTITISARPNTSSAWAEIWMPRYMSRMTSPSRAMKISHQGMSQPRLDALSSSRSRNDRNTGDVNGATGM